MFHVNVAGLYSCCIFLFVEILALSETDHRIYHVETSGGKHLELTRKNQKKTHSLVQYIDYLSTMNVFATEVLCGLDFVQLSLLVQHKTCNNCNKWQEKQLNLIQCSVPVSDRDIDFVLY